MLRLPESAIENFLENYGNGLRSSLLKSVANGKRLFIFNGPAGSGKTFLAEALAKRLGSVLTVINTYSVHEDEEANLGSVLLKTITEAALSRSLLSEGQKIVLVQDAEKVLRVDASIFKRLNGINGAIIIFESDSSEVFKSKNKKFLEGYEIVRLYRLRSDVVKTYLKRVAGMNGIVINDAILSKIARAAGGNMVSGLTDLRLFTTSGNDATEAPKRDSEDTIFERLSAVFENRTGMVDKHFSSENEAKLFEIWLTDKMPSVIKGDKLYSALERVSEADVLLRKIKAQNWWLLKYVSAILFDGVGAVCEGAYGKPTYYAPDWDAYYA